MVFGFLSAAIWVAVSVLVLLPAGSGGGGLPIPDKVAHFAAWFTLAGTTWLALGALRVPRRSVWTLALAAVWAVATELLQGFVPGRTTDALDALADVAGAVVAVAALAWWERARPRAALDAAGARAPREALGALGEDDLRG